MFEHLLIPTALAIVGWTQAILTSLQTWESVRYARRQLGIGKPRKTQASPQEPQSSIRVEQDNDQLRVAVMVPCKGDGDDLRTNLQPLFGQTYTNYELRFLVESPDDMATPILEEMMARNPSVASTIIHTGRATDCGQKVHNLLGGIDEIGNDIDVFAFVDSDACPNQGWLNEIISRLHEPNTGAVTGYRWMIPSSNALPNLAVYSLNSALAGLMGPGGHYPVWGGSWAIRKQTFDDLGIREAWSGTLSDDLVATRALRGAGIPVRFSPRCVSLSQIDFNWESAIEFTRRQYLIARHYTPRLWTLGTANHLAAQLGIWGSLAWACFGSGTAGRILAAATFAALYAVAVIRGFRRQQLVGCYAPSKGEELKLASQVDRYLSPAIGLANLCLLLASAVGHEIWWRGIRYRMSTGGRILTLGRKPAPQTAPQPILLKFPTPVNDESLRDRAAA